MKRKKKRKIEIGKLSSLDLDKVYHRELSSPMMNKYFVHDGNPCLYKNSPLAQFAMLYKKIGKEIFDVLDDNIYIQWTCEKFNNHSRKFKMSKAKWLIDVFDSVKKHGFCNSPFNPRDGISVKKGFYSTIYGDDPEGFTLLRRHHRTASCIALGMKRVYCLVYPERGRKFWR